MLLRDGAPVSWRSARGRTPLLAACYFGRASHRAVSLRRASLHPSIRPSVHRFRYARVVRGAHRARRRRQPAERLRRLARAAHLGVRAHGGARCYYAWRARSCFLPCRPRTGPPAPLLSTGARLVARGGRECAASRQGWTRRGEVAEAESAQGGVRGGSGDHSAHERSYFVCAYTIMMEGRAARAHASTRPPPVHRIGPIHRRRRCSRRTASASRSPRRPRRARRRAAHPRAASSAASSRRCRRLAAEIAWPHVVHAEANGRARRHDGDRGVSHASRCCCTWPRAHEKRTGVHVDCVVILVLVIFRVHTYTSSTLHVRVTAVRPRHCHAF